MFIFTGKLSRFTARSFRSLSAIIAKIKQYKNHKTLWWLIPAKRFISWNNDSRAKRSICFLLQRYHYRFLTKASRSKWKLKLMNFGSLEFSGNRYARGNRWDNMRQIKKISRSGNFALDSLSTREISFTICIIIISNLMGI